MKRLTTKTLADLRKSVPKGKKIVLCHGVFDLVHIGHLNYFESAKTYGDILVVSVTSDEFVNKGPKRPFNKANSRLRMLESLDIIDYVFLNDKKTSVNVIEILKPDFYVKGPDYKNNQDDITQAIKDEVKAVKKSGGKVVYTSDPVQSSSNLLNNYFVKFTDEQKDFLKKIKSKTSSSKILKIIKEIENFKVMVLGEAIIDRYTFVDVMNISSKSPTLSTKYLYHEDYTGGSLAIAKNLSALGCKANVFYPSGMSESDKNFNFKLKNKSEIKVTFTSLNLKQWNIPIKNRFLTEFRSQKIFEVSEIENKIWSENKVERFSQRINKISKNFDLFIYADFGHGLFNNEFIKSLNHPSKNISLNTQTNSENIGFNLFHKHEKYNYLCIDEREFRLAMHDRHTDTDSLLKKFYREYKKDLTVTLGSKGAKTIQGGKIFYCPSFFTSVVDTTGSGDAFLAISSVLHKMNIDPMINLFLSNIFAGLKSQIIGNKTPVDSVNLLKSVKYLLA